MSDAADRGFTVSELAPVGQPLDPLRETTAAFVGRALRGPLNQPVLISNFAEFRRRFGAVWKRSSLGPTVEQFFEHGGRQAYIVRIANKARGPLLCLPASGSALVLRALEPGSTEHIRAAVDYDGIPDDVTRFNLTIQRIDSKTGLVCDQEFYRRTSITQDKDGFVVDALLSSTIARAETPLPTHRPEATSSIDAAIASPYVEHAQDGSDGAELTDYDVVGSRRRATGLFALDAVPHFDILYIPPPGRDRDLGPTSILVADRYSRERGAILVVDPLARWTNPSAAIAGIRDLGYSSTNMLGYYPRMRHRDGRANLNCAVGGAVAGLLCKLDRTAGPWRGLDEAGTVFKRGYVPAVAIDDDAARELVRAGLNCIRRGRAGTAQLTGSVTLGHGRDSQQDQASLPARRMVLKVIAELDRSTRRAVFEPGAERLAVGIQDQLDAYLDALMLMGAFDEPPKIRCDVRRARGAAAANDITIHIVVKPAGCERRQSITVHQGVAGCRAATTVFGPADT